jgi:hypothetical protein
VNILELLSQAWRSIKRFIDFMLMKRSFNYVARMSPQDCLQRLRGLSQPKTGFWNARSQSVLLTQEERHYRFEVCVERYGRGGVYNSAKAAGIITATIDKTATTIVSGNIRLRFSVLWFIVFALGFLFIMTVGNFSRLFGFYILFLVVSLVFIARDYRDYRKLENLIHDTFSDVVAVTNELPQ